MLSHLYRPLKRKQTIWRVHIFFITSLMNHQWLKWRYRTVVRNMTWITTVLLIPSASFFTYVSFLFVFLIIEVLFVSETRLWLFSGGLLNVWLCSRLLTCIIPRVHWGSQWSFLPLTADLGSVYSFKVWWTNWLAGPGSDVGGKMKHILF